MGAFGGLAQMLMGRAASPDQMAAAPMASSDPNLDSTQAGIDKFKADQAQAPNAQAANAGNSTGNDAFVNPMQNPQPQELTTPVKKGLSNTVMRLLSNFAIGGVPALAFSGNLAKMAVDDHDAKLAETRARTAQLQATAEQMKPTPMLDPESGKPVLDENGEPRMVPKWYAQAQIAYKGKTASADIAGQYKLAAAQITQGQPMVVPQEVAEMAGMPELADQKVGKSTWQNINAALSAQGKNVTITDIGDKRYLFNKATGEKKELGTSPGLVAGVARAQAFARAKADNTPFQTFDAQGNVTTVPVSQAIANGFPAATAWNSIFGPTSSTKSQGQAAGAVAEHIPFFKESVQRLDAKGELGPVMGRLNTYLTQGYGGSDPDIAEFVSTIGLLKTGAVRAHFGARGGAQVLGTFDHYLNTGQTGPALLGSINGIEKFLNTYKSVGTANPPKSNIPPQIQNGMDAGKPPAGAKVRDYTSLK